MSQNKYVVPNKKSSNVYDLSKSDQPILQSWYTLYIIISRKVIYTERLENRIIKKTAFILLWNSLCNFSIYYTVTKLQRWKASFTKSSALFPMPIFYCVTLKKQRHIETNRVECRKLFDNTIQNSKKIKSIVHFSIAYSVRFLSGQIQIIIMTSSYATA